MDPKAGERVSDSWGHRSVACRLQVFKPLSLLLGEGTLPLQNIAAIGVGALGTPNRPGGVLFIQRTPTSKQKAVPMRPCSQALGEGS